MELSDVRRTAIEPALLLLPARMESPQAVVMLLAIGLQESRFTHRRQIGGPVHPPRGSAIAQMKTRHRIIGRTPARLCHGEIARGDPQKHFFRSL